MIATREEFLSVRPRTATAYVKSASEALGKDFEIVIRSIPRGAWKRWMKEAATGNSDHIEVMLLESIVEPALEPGDLEVMTEELGHEFIQELVDIVTSYNNGTPPKSKEDMTAAEAEEAEKAADATFPEPEAPESGS